MILIMHDKYIIKIYVLICCIYSCCHFSSTMNPPYQLAHWFLTIHKHHLAIRCFDMLHLFLLSFFNLTYTSSPVQHTGSICGRPRRMTTSGCTHMHALCGSTPETVMQEEQNGWKRETKGRLARFACTKPKEGLPGLQHHARGTLLMSLQLASTAAAADCMQTFVAGCLPFIKASHTSAAGRCPFPK